MRLTDKSDNLWERVTKLEQRLAKAEARNVDLEQSLKFAIALVRERGIGG